MTSTIWRFVLIAFVALGSVHAELTDKELGAVEFRQYPGRALPLNLDLVNSEGAAVQLSDYFKGTPVVLVPGYFRCRMLCEGVSDGLILALQGSRLHMGSDYRVLFVSINPNESTDESQARKRTFLKRCGRRAVVDGCDFLTGQPKAISALANTIGFHYRYDPQSGEFAHPAGIVIIRADGTISSYLFGVSFSAGELERALVGAARMEKPSLAQRLVLLCFHYDPLRARYSARIIFALRIIALLTLAGLVAFAVRFARSRPPAENDSLTKGAEKQ